MKKGISKIEHAFHIILSLATAGIWFVIYLFRIIYVVTQNKTEPISKKDKIMSEVHKLNEKIPKATEIGTYTKRKFSSIEEAEDDEYFEFSDDYTFEAVGESHYRENLLAIIEKNNAHKLGELQVDAVLVKEPNNKFDEFAVAIFIDNKKVGHVSSDYSFEVTTYIDEKNLNGIKVKAVVGWNTGNPNPPIGVRLDFNF